MRSDENSWQNDENAKMPDNSGLFELALAAMFLTPRDIV
jgi:hypothetical protein